jgi:adenine-specific DNA-methyltransferase
MANKKTKLELTWIGKENRPKLEPRILIEDREKSCHARHRVSDDDIFDNRLIYGDNLLALKALEQEFAGKIKCIYIDPPFNTGEMFENYDDGIEHSLWLSQMRDRLKILHNLLASEGTLFVHIDDNEMGYLIVLLDEVFQRANRLYVISFKQGSATGHKAINPGCVNTTNFLLMYAKNRSEWTPNRVFTARKRDKRYNQFIVNPTVNYREWKFVTLTQAFADARRLSLSEARKLVKKVADVLDEFVMDNASNVIRLARPDYKGVSAAARDMIDQSKEQPEVVIYLEREGHSDMYFVRGERILFYADKLKMIDGKMIAGEPLTTLWDDILSNNLHKEGGVAFPKGKKPEFLVKRVLDLTTKPGDWILDSFGGSGTTGAVAHKMGRRWIMVELGDHCDTHIVPRLRRVIDSQDDSGITKAIDWKGGGGFRYYRLGPSLIVEDEWGNPVINSEFNAAMLAEAMCKLEGFEYAPSEDVYWIHGKSTETDFLYVTTQFMSKEMLTRLSDEVGPERSLLICCSAFRCDPGQFPNLTIKKIPKAVLKKCEWGHDDYSLEIENLPKAPPGLDEPAEVAPAKPRRKFGKGSDDQLSLFDVPRKGAR